MEDEEELPCEREEDPDNPRANPDFWCVNDHTGCIWNDGNNTCMAPADAGTSPLGKGQ